MPMPRIAVAPPRWPHGRVDRTISQHDGRSMTANTPDNSGDSIDRVARVIAQSLAHGLREAEMLGAEREAQDRQAAESQTAVSPQLVETLERFGEAMSRLAEFTEQLGARMNELTDAVARLAEAPSGLPAPSTAAPHLPPLEASFAPGGEGVDVTIAAVPGFQGLMDLQRALVRLPQVQSAAVRRYQDDEAAIQLVLSQPMTPGAIIEGVSAATGRQITIDEARPEALRLRLRFLA
jgi:hypothetical protein